MVTQYTQYMSESIHTNDIDTDELPTTADCLDNINNIFEPGKGDDNTDETDYQADLKSLSNLKKYKINMLCTQNLKEIGLSNLVRI